MSSDPLVSVVMSVYNGQRFLREAVESILNQTFREFEFIIIDDGSTDGSGILLDAYQKKDSRLRVYHQGNRGLIEALNRGCSLAQGQYVARMDADDIAIQDRLHRQVDFLEEHPEIGLLGGYVEYIDVTGRVFDTYRHPIGDQAIRSALYQGDGSFCHPATVMRKSVLDSTGGYRSCFLDAEDYDLWLRMARGTGVGNLDTVVLKYRVHPDQVSQRKLAQQCLSMLGARTIALSSRAGEWDAPSSGCVITPAMLGRLGVSEAKQQQAVAAGYRNWICTLALAGYISGALSLANDMLRSSQWEHVENSLIADVWLIRASLYRRQRRFLSSLLAVSRALMIRPIVAGRPLKRLLAGLSKHFRRASAEGVKGARLSTPADV